MKTFVVKPINGQIEVFLDGKPFETLDKGWRQKLQYWRKNGWTIVWS